MRTFPSLLAITALAAACSSDAPSPAPPPPIASDTASTVRLTPLTGSDLRYDGVYHTSTGDIQYYMRFFERGNVALVTGPETPKDSVHIADFLTESVQSGWNNVHNVPVERRNDSLFFQTMAVNGAITYAGVVAGDSVRFLKVSHINGKRAVVTYAFEPDRTLK